MLATSHEEALAKVYSKCLILIAVIRLNAYHRGVKLDGRELWKLVSAVSKSATKHNAAGEELRIAVSIACSIFSVDQSTAIRQLDMANRQMAGKSVLQISKRCSKLFQDPEFVEFLSSHQIEGFDPNGESEGIIIKSSAASTAVDFITS